MSGEQSAQQGYWSLQATLGYTALRQICTNSYNYAKIKASWHGNL